MIFFHSTTLLGTNCYQIFIDVSKEDTSVQVNEAQQFGTCYEWFRPNPQPRIVIRNPYELEVVAKEIHCCGLDIQLNI